ncbi:cysteine hydrolase [Shewanella sp. SR43-4]|jgi:nicotinamidase-related amidase|uniref:cysteine hydrolase family protein n=1 Tax=Shewanella sp. SR43-4 TaxID=2760942 RepID=UPI0015FAA1B6|nr:cysteine hydrolase family protein [Shewanella sp. SR43-4]MBB1319938.1 cysteine hydrolase [Shewanella sp. SR43-4]
MTIAVLVIDVQRGLFDPEPRPFDVNNVLEKINTVTNWARNSDYPVIYIQHEQAESIMEYESKGWQLQGDLVIKESDIVVRKTTPDSFLRTNLESVLKRNKVEHLIVVGYASEFCVDTTVRRAASLGYSIELVSDAHTTHNKEHASGEAIRMHHNCTLPEVTSFGVKITAIQTSELVKLV